jgi:hypothetical protein
MMVQTPYGSGHLAPESDVNVVTSHHYVLYGFLTPGCNGCTGEITSLWIVWCGRPWFLWCFITIVCFVPWFYITIQWAVNTP